MEPFISDDELLKMEDVFKDSTQDQWQFMLVREASEKDFKSPDGQIRKQKIDPRWDVFTGPPLSQDEKVQPMQIALKGRKQILHFHPESPQMFERCSNIKDGVFVVVAHDLVPKMIAEIKRLKGG